MRRATQALIMIALVLASSLLTYMIVSGYWYRLGIEVPNTISLAITDVYFPLNNTKWFNITVMNPSYSLSEASIESIWVITPDDEAHKVLATEPWLPRTIEAGGEIRFKCYWNWANYTGDELKILVLPKEGSGASVKARPPAVELELTPFFNASSPFWFILNITNSPESPANVSICGVDLLLDNGTWVRDLPTEPAVSPDEPRVVSPNSTLTLNCTWDWLAYRNRTITIVAKTKEGYRGYLFNYRTPPPVVLKITEVVFAVVNNTYYFNITVFNEPTSPAPARICNLTALVNNTLFLDLEALNVMPPFNRSAPYVLQPNASATFTCYWNWSLYEGSNMTITISTVLGYTANATVNITAGIIKLAVAWVSIRAPGEPTVRSYTIALSALGQHAWPHTPQAWRDPQLCAPRAQTQTSALCGLGRSRRSSRRGWPPPMPPR